MPNCTTKHYAAFINLHAQPVCVIGGGKVATRKVETLLKYDAKVTLISPQVTDTLARLANSGRITWKTRAYQNGDLHQVRLAICAVGDIGVNKAAYTEAQTANCLINVVDVPDLCDFIVPAVVDRGPLQIAISTSGSAPTIAKRIKGEIAATYDENWTTYCLLLGEIRGLVMARVNGGEQVRKPLFEALAESDLLARIQKGNAPTAKTAYDEYVVPFMNGGRA